MDTKNTSQQAPINNGGGAYEAYLSHNLDKSGARKISGRDNKTGAVYTTGPFKGKTPSQARAMSREYFSKMSDDERKPYEDMAAGKDIRSKREQEAMGGKSNMVTSGSSPTKKPKVQEKVTGKKSVNEKSKMEDYVGIGSTGQNQINSTNNAFKAFQMPSKPHNGNKLFAV